MGLIVIAKERYGVGRAIFQPGADFGEYDFSDKRKIERASVRKGNPV